MNRGLVLGLALLAGCAAPPPTEQVPETVTRIQAPSVPSTPPDRALGLYGPPDEETSAAPVATYDGRERAADFYAVENPGSVHLQRAGEATASFPRDRLGNVDWVQALAAGHIAPRADREGRGTMRTLESAILMTATADMPYVRFPHREHTAWLDCSNCHPAPFLAEQGANPITMTAILKGEFCGVCHDRVAFSTYACERCHSVPNPEAPVPAW